jgi:hypothetical protein
LLSPATGQIKSRMDIVIGIADRFIAVRSLLNWVKPFKTPELSRVATPEIERDIRSRAIGAKMFCATKGFAESFSTRRAKLTHRW